MQNDTVQNTVNWEPLYLCMCSKCLHFFISSLVWLQERVGVECAENSLVQYIYHQVIQWNESEAEILRVFSLIGPAPEDSKVHKCWQIPLMTLYDTAFFTAKPPLLGPVCIISTTEWITNLVFNHFFCRVSHKFWWSLNLLFRAIIWSNPFQSIQYFWLQQILPVLRCRKPI